MSIRPSRLVAALSYVIDPVDAPFGMDQLLDVGREIWRVSDGSRYELWSDLCHARGIDGPIAEAKWRTFLYDHDGPDAIERLARTAGWDGGFDAQPEPARSIWDEWSLQAPDFIGAYVVRPPRATTGVWALDEALGGGVASGTYTAVGGEGGTGKTALAVLMAYANMMRDGFCPLFYSLEVPRVEVVARMLSLHSASMGILPPIRWSDLLAAPEGDGDGSWQADEDERRRRVERYLREHRGPDAARPDPVLAVHDDMMGRMVGRMAIRDGVSGVDDLCAEVDAVAAEGVHVLPIVDHIHVLDPPRGTRGDSEYERVTAVSHALMACAKRNNVPMLALAEIRNVGEKERDVPRLTWFRGSGHVGYDAGCAVILTHDERKGEHGVRPVVANVVKNRHGHVGAAVQLSFTGALNHIE